MGGAHPFESSHQMRRRMPPAPISTMAAITKPASTLRRMCHIHLFFNLRAALGGHGFLCQPLSHCVAVWQHREKSGDCPKQRRHCIGPPIRGNGDLFHIESSNKEALDPCRIHSIRNSASARGTSIQHNENPMNGKLHRSVALAEILCSKGWFEVIGRTTSSYPGLHCIKDRFFGTTHRAEAACRCRNPRTPHSGRKLRQNAFHKQSTSHRWYLSQAR